ncbi:MAG: indolepyruvate ferredoxin oxidoreductase subunit alpha [Oscillospiraceae bacterium]|nr:indolepyruvate ferredoxin oxidoreductase subunit alpha [Oscillospiraceae bacterium]
MQKLLLGNEAVARGFYEAGVTVVSSYPGTPSTEITQYSALYDEIYTEWSPNEKVSAEVAIGASIAGARAATAMKHVGLNVASDPLYTAAYTGVNGGLVVCVADDPGIHSSQNEQDSRGHAKTSKTPMLEPSDSSECLSFTKLGFELSEKFDTPVFIRLSTRISHSRGLCDISERIEFKNEYKKNMPKFVAMPNTARPRHEFVEQRMRELTEWAETCGINRVEMNNAKIGVITSGVAYQYAKEALGENASYLKLGMVNPLPVRLIKDFASKADVLYVIEELDDVIETHCRKNGVEVIGKELFSFCGEIRQDVIADKILNKKPEIMSLQEEIPARPPVMCAGCSHRGLFWALKKTGCVISGDIGCYTLSAGPPLSAMDTCICMGASVSAAHGFHKAEGENGKKVIGVIGDSTFAHSGITGLINAVYNGAGFVTVIADNATTGMTGHQDNPTTGKTLKKEAAPVLDLVALCKSIGVPRVRVVDPNNLSATLAALKEEVESGETSVVIARRPCVLLKDTVLGDSLMVDAEACTFCKVCFQIGCPAIISADGKAVIDENQCVGCGQCTGLCRFQAIKGRA